MQEETPQEGFSTPPASLPPDPPPLLPDWHAQWLEGKHPTAAP